MVPWPNPTRLYAVLTTGTVGVTVRLAVALVADSHAVGDRDIVVAVRRRSGRLPKSTPTKLRWKLVSCCNTTDNRSARSHRPSAVKVTVLPANTTCDAGSEMKHRGDGVGIDVEDGIGTGDRARKVAHYDGVVAAIAGSEHSSASTCCPLRRPTVWIVL